MTTKRWVLVLCIALCASFCWGQTKSRLIILADMGNEPDEEQQMVHMTMCSNAFDLEGLLPVTGKYLRPESKNPYKQKLHPELFYKIIDAYAKVVENLKKHASGWHDPQYLRSIVKEGQKGYGIGDVGKGKASPGSKLILNAVMKDDPRPIWIVVNAGSNTLAQALWDYRDTHTKAEVDAFVAKLRVFENGAQDNAGAWICSKFPKIHWIRSNYQTYAYGGPSFRKKPGKGHSSGPNVWQPYKYSADGQHKWAEEHIMKNHGALGEVFPYRGFGKHLHFLEGGGTFPWMGLVNQGLFDIDHPAWGGWSGRFTREKVKNCWSRHKDVKKDEQANAPFFAYYDTADRWTDPATGTEYTGNNVPAWRWRQAMYNDFRCRMDWCVQPYEKANHHPVAVFNGDSSNTIIRMKVAAGDTIKLDSTGSSDPDGDALDISWWVYSEAGTYDKPITIPDAAKAATSLVVPADSSGKQIHVILEIKDRSKIASLYDYRRIVLDVK